MGKRGRVVDVVKNDNKFHDWEVHLEDYSIHTRYCIACDGANSIIHTLHYGSHYKESNNNICLLNNEQQHVLSIHFHTGSTLTQTILKSNHNRNNNGMLHFVYNERFIG